MIANRLRILILLTRDILPINFDNIRLVLFYAIGYGVLDKLVEWLDLLVNHTILVEESIDYLPLIIYIYLILSISIDVQMIHILLYFLIFLFWQRFCRWNIYYIHFLIFFIYFDFFVLIFVLYKNGWLYQFRLVNYFNKYK